MAKPAGNSAFKQAFIARVRWARKARYETQEEIAGLLRIPQDKYKWYETKRFMPHELIASFCTATGVDAAWLYTEKGKAPAVARVTADPPRVLKARKNKAKAA